MDEENEKLIKEAFEFCLKEERDVFMENFDTRKFLRANKLDETDENIDYAQRLYEIEKTIW